MYLWYALNINKHFFKDEFTFIPAKKKELGVLPQFSNTGPLETLTAQ